MDVSFRQAETNIINVEADLCKERPTIRDLSSHPVGVENSPETNLLPPGERPSTPSSEEYLFFSCRRAVNFFAKMHHQIAPNFVSNFKIFMGMTPPDLHPWGGDIPFPDPSPARRFAL